MVYIICLLFLAKVPYGGKEYDINDYEVLVYA